MLSKFSFLKNNATLRHYAANTGWLFMERIFKIPVGLIMVILLTRYLGPENYGLLSYSQSFVGLFVAFTTLGLEVLLVRELIKNKEQTDVILGTAFILKLGASLVALILIMVINFFHDDKQTILLTNIIAFTLIFQSLNLGMDTYFQANVLSKFSSISNSIAYLLSIIVKLYLIFIAADLIYFAYALVLDCLVVFIGYALLYQIQKKSILSFKYDKKIAFYFLNNGWPMMMVAMAVVFYTKIDQIMIKQLIDAKSVGYYAAALKISELFYFIPLLIAQSVFPKIVQEREKGKTEEYFKLLLNVMKIVIWISIPIVLFMIIFSDLIVMLVFGTAYEKSSDILSILIFCLIPISIGSISTKILYIEHYEKKYLQRSLFGLFINIGLNFILIGIYGVTGAAIATLVTLFVIHYVYDFFDKDLWPFYYLKFKCFILKLK